jgi:hypothetical protein
MQELFNGSSRKTKINWASSSDWEYSSYESSKFELFDWLRDFYEVRKSKSWWNDQGSSCFKNGG